jgi:organic radical activating enzyme
MIDLDKLPQVKKELDAVGCGFCLAKWTQVTMHLGSGLTHSCHHVGAHKIPLDELAVNPSALHNTNFKKEIRKEMLAGKRPTECDYCWRIEDNTNNFSDRITKSSEKWSTIDKDKIIAATGDENIYPRYVEVSFSNVCNFKCTYCGPAFSSKWTEEIKANGAYILKNNHYNSIKETEIPILEREENPYIEAFWKWFPEAVQHMHVFRITGGEPLLSKHTKRVIQYLIENPQPNLEFAINSNACPPNLLWKEFVNSIKELEASKSIKSFSLYTSAESVKGQAEYSRDGMDWKLFDSNIKYFLEQTTDIKVCFMSAFNILSLPTIHKFVRHIEKLKRDFGERVVMDFAYVRHPEFLDIKIATEEMIETYLKTTIDFMIERRKKNKRFKMDEILKLQRIYNDCLARFKKKINVNADRFRFVQFINEYDRRRNKNFLEVFPEYKEFYKLCENSNV